MNDKWGQRLFTAGAAWLIVMGLVHSLSFFAGQAAANEPERQLIDLMTNYKMNLMGTMRTMSDLFRGFSISFMLATFVVGALDFAVRRERSWLLKWITLVNVLWLAVMLAVSLRYFFVIPIAFLSVALVIFVAAWATLPREVSS